MVSLDLLIAAPSDPATLNSWGDVHFARALQRGFHRLGIVTRLLFRDTYQSASAPSDDAVLLVLRGKFKPDLDWLNQASYRRRVVWLISWPDDPDENELACYHLGFSASFQDLWRLRGLSTCPWHGLPQASEFLLQGPPRPVRSGLLFVGNCRGGPRPMVELFDRAGLSLCLFGAGWSDAGYLSRGDQIANGALASLYRRSLAVLNDHHPAMARLGYLSNRVFDVLACGVPVISDSIAGCPAELQDLVIVHTPDQNPLDTLARVAHLRTDVERLRQRAQTVHRHHSFRRRAEQIVERISSL